MVTQTAIAPTLSPTPTEQVTPQATEVSVLPPEVTLNVWLISEVSSLAEAPGGTILAEQLSAFELNHPNVNLNVEIKSPEGQGGTLSYLRSGRDIAPSILPDLIVLPTDLIPTAASEELIFPLDELIAAENIDDLYPAASSLARFGDEIYGYPFALSNLSHMAYSTTIFTDTIPITWDEFVEDEEASFTFAGGGVPGAELTLQFYLAHGGKLADELGEPMLDADPLATALSNFSLGRENGLLPIETSNLTSYGESWQSYINGDAASVQTVNTQFAVERSTALDSDFSSIPGVDAPLVPLLKGSAWAISTPDPARQTVTAELLNWLSAGPNVGDWSHASGNLPGRRSAFVQWPENDSYTIFVQQELERSDPYPITANNLLLNALSTAVFDVLTQNKSPQLAAEEAAASLGR